MRGRNDVWRGRMTSTARRTVLATAAILAVLAAPLRAETLTDALVAAYRNSNLLEQNRAVLRAADEDAAIAVSALRPVLTFIANSTYRYVEARSQFTDARISDETLTSNVGLVAEMTLFDFGRNNLAIEAARESVLATREALIAVEQNVLLSAVTAFVQVLLTEEIVRLRQNNVSVINEQLRAARDRFEVGEITRTDVSIAEARLAGASAELAVAEGDLMQARESYRAATGAYPGRLAATPPPPPTAESLDAARAVALRTHPLIRQGQREVAVSELNVLRAKAETRPTLSGGASLRVDDEGFNTNAVTLDFNQTLYAGGRLSAQFRRALAARDATRAGLQQTGVTIAQDVGNAWARLDVAAASIEASLQQVEAQQIAFDGITEEATLGARTTLDVLDAEQDLLDARASVATERARRYIAIYALLSSMGLLTVEHLKLGIPVYDPAAYYNAVRNAPATSTQGKRLDRVLKTIGGN